MLKQQDTTETTRVVFNELSATEPVTVGEIAQDTYLSRKRCQLMLTQLVTAGLADHQFGCYRRLQFWRLFHLWQMGGWWVLGAFIDHLLMRLDRRQTSGPPLCTEAE